MNDKPKVYCTYNSFGQYGDEAIRLLESVTQLEKNPNNRPLARTELLEAARNADGIITWYEWLDETLLQKLDKLKIIGWHPAGLDGINLRVATEAGVTVVYTPGGNADSVAEFTMGLILSATKRISKSETLAKLGIWDLEAYSELYQRTVFGTQLRGKTLGIIGFGKIGSRVSTLARAFGMNVIVHDSYVPKERIEHEGAKSAFFEELLRQSDVVTIHCQLTEETKRMIDREAIDLMKRGVYLINTARGAIVDEDALYNALKEKKIAFAALDVLTKEPPDPDNPLLTLNNIIVTPHIASYTAEAMRAKDMMLAEDFVRFFKGEQPKYIANPEVTSVKRREFRH